MKICSKCKIEKEEKDFDRDRITKDGFNYQCKKCIYESKHLKEHFCECGCNKLTKNKRFIKGHNGKKCYISVNKENYYKVCTKCKISKIENEFNQDKGKKDGLYSSCKQCVEEYKKEYNKKIKINLCKCGCEELCKQNYKQGHSGRGKSLPEEWADNIAKSHIGIPMNENTKLKLIKSHLGIKQSSETIEKRVSQFRGKQRPLEVNEKVSQSIKELWKNKDYIRKQSISSQNSPNKCEQYIIKLLEENFPGKYKFVGNWKITIDGKCPDFIDEKDKKIIEFFGEYWHKPEDEQIRTNHFRKFGYKTLIIWEKEIKSEQKIIEKLKKFIYYPIFTETIKNT